MAKSNKVIRDFEELPVIMNVKDFQEATGLSKVTAYEVVNSKGFKKIKVGKRILIPKSSFIEWIEENSTLCG